MNAATQAGARINGLKQSLSTFWNERNQRERRMLLAALTVVVLGLIYALLIDPAISGRDDLEKRLPVLRQQAAEVQVLAKQASAAGSGATATAAAPAPLTRESLETSLSRKGLKAQNLSVTGELARLQLNDASFAATVEWLAEMQRSVRLAVVDAKIEGQAQADTVNASFTLRQQRGEQTR
jgi:general secretion pathway protein M